MKNIMRYVILLIINMGYTQDGNYAQQPYSEPDILIWENDTIQIQTFPLNHWSKFDQTKLFGKKEIKPNCWGCLKNYKAEWKIINNKLYLSNIYSYNFKKNAVKADLTKLFPNKVKNKLILVDWYSGNLFVPKGQSIRIAKSPGFPIYESEWKLMIEKGLIKNKEFKTNNYYKSIYTQNPKKLVGFIDKHLDEKTRGKLKNKLLKIAIKTGASKNDSKIVTNKIEDKDLKQSLTQILKTLPEFDYYYRHGEALNLTIPVSFILSK